MATVNSDIRYRLLGQDVSAGSTFRKVAGEAQAAHSAIGTLGNALNSAGSFGPLQQGLSAVGQAFSHIEENGKRATVVMQGIGLGIAGVGAALLAVGSSEQQAAAGLKSSIEATGAIFTDYKGRIEETIAQQEKFGHAANDTQDALSRLTQATNDPAAALQLMGVAANVAAARNISLNDAATTLSQGLAGNTRAFRQFGITLDGVGTKADQITHAFDQLEQKLAGQASAKADTFSGHIKAMGVQLEDTVASLSKFSPYMLAAGSAITLVASATDYMNRSRAREVETAGAATAAETRLARAQATSGSTALAAGSETAAGGRFGGIIAGGNLLKGGAFALGGVLAGQLVSAGVGGRAGSTLGDALGGAGIGAGIGSVVPVIGTGVGAVAGGLVGGAFGLFHHGGPSASDQQANIRQIVDNLNTEQRAQADAALTAKFAGFLPGEFDPLGNPKAKALAAATESLAKAKERLRTAQDALNKTETTAQDPLKLAAASARLSAAEAALHKAQYTGQSIAAAEASVASARAALATARTGPDTTAGQRRVHDAQQAVNDARRRANAARRATRGLGIGQVLAREHGNLHTAREDVRAQATLVRDGLTRAVIEEVDALNKQTPGTLEAVAGSLTPATAARMNRLVAEFAHEQTRFAAIGKSAAIHAQRQRGEELASAFYGAYQSKLTRLATDADAHNINPVPVPYSYGGTGMNPNRATAGVTESQYGIHIQNMTVQANDPKKFSREMAGQARHRALASGGGERRYGFDQ